MPIAGCIVFVFYKTTLSSFMRNMGEWLDTLKAFIRNCCLLKKVIGAPRI